MAKKTTSRSYRKKTLNSHNDPKLSGSKPKNYQERQKKRYEVQQIKEDLLNFAHSHWGHQWIESILKYGRPYRMQRGMRYAEENRIENLTVTPGQIFGTVQGTAPTPYRIKIKFKTIPEEGWDKILDKIAKKVKYIIALLENKIPDDLQQIFQEAGFDLFPPASKTLNASCSCPDQAVPCKHIAATILYTARVLDFDPFLLLKLRGKSRDDLLHDLQLVRSCANKPIVQSTHKIREKIHLYDDAFDVPSLNFQDLSHKNFLSGELFEIGFSFSKPGVHFDILDTLGIAPNVEKPLEFEEVMKDLYATVTNSIFKKGKSLETNLK